MSEKSYCPICSWQRTTSQDETTLEPKHETRESFVAWINEARFSEPTNFTIICTIERTINETVPVCITPLVEGEPWPGQTWVGMGDQRVTILSPVYSHGDGRWVRARDGDGYVWLISVSDLRPKLPTEPSVEELLDRIAGGLGISTSASWSAALTALATLRKRLAER